MNILFYRYGNICEPDLVQAFQQLGLQVREETTEINDKKISASTRIELVEAHLKAERPLFVFSINFFPVIADLCHLYQVLYLCWTVDSPVLELFSKSITHPTNHIFMFDRAQYNTFVPFNPTGIHPLPLASATDRFDRCIATMTETDCKTFSADISFVGSLYSEKDLLPNLSGLSDYTRGVIDGITEASLRIAGYYPAGDVLPQEVAAEIANTDPNFPVLGDTIADPNGYIVSQRYLGYHIASLERIRTLNALAKHFPTHLFTRSDTSCLKNVVVHEGVRTLDEMPKVFHLSKINLNMTIKPIQTGLPLRIFDICGCGGFLMTNFQEELSELFEIGTDVEAYTCLDELIEKCKFYLEHEEIRIKIAQSGYEKCKRLYTYPQRIQSMLQLITGN